ncbi:LYR motif-containing protein 4, partial [Astyanax mexicanus]
MAASSRAQVLSLYRSLLKESRAFPSYNYRTYALRRVRDAFRENRSVKDPQALELLLNKARDSLAIIQRQVLLTPAEQEHGHSRHTIQRSVLSRSLSRSLSLFLLSSFSPLGLS